MKSISNSPTLRAWLKRHSHTAGHIPTSEFHFDEEIFAQARAEIAAHHPGMSQDQVEMRAAFLLLREGHLSKPLSHEVKSGIWTLWLRDVWTSLCRKPIDEVVWRIIVLLLLAVIAFAVVAKAEPEPTNSVAEGQVIHALLFRPQILAQGNAGGGNSRMWFWNGSNAWTPVASGTPFPVTCVSGCSAAGAFTDNTAFTVGTTSVSNLGAYFTSGADPTLSTGNSGRIRMDSHSYLFVDCVVGCAGGSTTPADAFANPTTAGLQFDLLAGFNGTTWDRLQVDASKFLKVNVAAALPAGSALIGHVVDDSGSTTAVTGNVAVTKADGSDVTLGAKADAKSTATDTTAVSIMSVLKEISALEQAPAALPSNQSVRLDQVAGTALGATAVTNFGTAPAAAAVPGVNASCFIVTTACSANSGTKDAGTLRVVLATDQPQLTNKLLVTPDSVALPANQSVNVAQIAGNTTTTTDNGTQGVAPQGTASSTGALPACNILSAASTNSTSCKGSAGNFYGYEVFNTSTTVYYLRLYNSSSAPTCSSATGFIRTIPVPPAAAAGQVGGAISNQNFPVNFGTGIGYCITGGSSSTDNTNAATGVFGEIRYK